MRYIRNPRYGPLSEENPELVAEWDFEYNAPLTPDMVTPGSDIRVRWRCKDDSQHTWITAIKDRKRTGCPACARKRASTGLVYPALTEAAPQLIDEWDFERNQISPSDVSAGSQKKVWWVCNTGHHWRTTVASRALVSQGLSDCPMCANRLALLGGRSKGGVKFRSLADENPELLVEWDHEQNLPLTPQTITPGSGRKVWWICRKNQNHRWATAINDRARKGRGCPHCYRERRKKKIKRRFDPTGRKGSSRQSPRRSTRGGSSFDIGPRKPRRYLRRYNPIKYLPRRYHRACRRCGLLLEFA